VIRKKRFKDTLKASLKDFSINVTSWEALAEEKRSSWRNLILTGDDSAEKQRTLAAGRRRKRCLGDLFGNLHIKFALF